MIAKTPEPPYYAVIFTSLRTDIEEGYDQMADLMESLAKEQPGYLGFESARSKIGLSVSYWKDLESIRKWKGHVDHQAAQQQGKEKWYQEYKVRVTRVERDY